MAFMKQIRIATNMDTSMCTYQCKIALKANRHHRADWEPMQSFRVIIIQNRLRLRPYLIHKGRENTHGGHQISTRRRRTNCALSCLQSWYKSVRSSPRKYGNTKMRKCTTLRDAQFQGRATSPRKTCCPSNIKQTCSFTRMTGGLLITLMRRSIPGLKCGKRRHCKCSITDTNIT